ncbi:hypothetical protein D3C87_1525710 [compost metagenome]
MKQPEQQDQYIKNQERSTSVVQVGDQPGLPAQPQQHLNLSEAGIGEAQVAAAVKHREQRGLADHHQCAADGDACQRLLIVPGKKRQPQQQQSQGIGAGCEGKTFEQQSLDGVMGQSLTHRMKETDRASYSTDRVPL